MADLLELTPHISLLKLMNATSTNVYIVREPDGDTLIDPGPVGTAPVILALDRRGEIRLRRLIVTHAHPAHAGSVARVARGTGVRIYVHPLDMCYLDGREPPLLPRGRRGQLMAALGRVVELCPPVFRMEPLTGPVGSLEPIETPGHTPGHVCLYHRQDRALISGDALIVEDGQLALPDDKLSEDPGRAHTSLSRLRLIGYEHLLPGHGAPLLGGASARRGVAAMKELLDAWAQKHGVAFEWRDDFTITYTSSKGAWFVSTQPINGDDDWIAVHPTESGCEFELVASAGHVEVLRLSSPAELQEELDGALEFFRRWTSFFSFGPGQGH